MNTTEIEDLDEIEALERLRFLIAEMGKSSRNLVEIYSKCIEIAEDIKSIGRP